MTSTTKDRAFVMKLNRAPATDVRKKVSEAMKRAGEDQMSIASLSDTSSPFQSIFTDLVEPMDVEAQVAKHKPFPENDSFAAHYDVPGDDVDVMSVPSKKSSQRAISRASLYSKMPDPLYRDIMDSYCAEWVVVSRRSQQWPQNRTENLLNSLPVGMQTTWTYESENPTEVSMVQTTEKRPEMMYRISWASGMQDLKSSSMDRLLPEIVQRTPLEQLLSISRNMRINNESLSLFQNFFIREEEDNTLLRAPPLMPLDSYGSRILIRILDMRLDFNLEPVFGVLALYDGKTKRKISETFHFECNTDETKRLIADLRPVVDKPTTCQSALFTVSQSFSDVYVVVRIEKVLQQGDLNDIVEPYTKDNLDAKAREKLRRNCEQFCPKMGGLRMPFAWNAYYALEACSSLYDDASSVSSVTSGGSSTSSRDYNSLQRRSDSSMSRRSASGSDHSLQSLERSLSDTNSELLDLPCFKSYTVKLGLFYKQEVDKMSDEELFRILPEIRRNTLQKKCRWLQGNLHFEIGPPPENLGHMYGSDMETVYDFDPSLPPVREVDEFLPKDCLLPFTTFRNSLYINLKRLNFASRTGSARNITIKVQLLPSEDKNQALKCIYGRSCGSQFVTESYSPVTYHNRSPEFYEEVKISLPVPLTPEHHILFTFYHVSFGSDGTSAENSVVGYTWLPLLQGDLISSGELSLPVGTDILPKGYSRFFPEQLSQGMKWLDNRKGLFDISVNLVSSVYPQDAIVTKFLRAAMTVDRISSVDEAVSTKEKANEEAALQKAIKDLDVASTEALVKFLYIILNKLFMVLVIPTAKNSSSTLNRTAFEMLVHVVHRIHLQLDKSPDSLGRSSLLTSYLSHILDTLDLHGDYGDSIARANTISSSKSTDTICERTSMDSQDGGKWRGKKLIHDILVMHWQLAIQPYKDMSINRCWFLLEAILKSMTQYLHATKNLDRPEYKVFSDSFMNGLNNCLQLVINEIIAKQDRNYLTARQLNANLAYFITDLLSIIDRGMVLKMIYNYWKELSSARLMDSTAAPRLRLDFIQILTMHEHFLSVNMPFLMPLDELMSSSVPKKVTTPLDALTNTVSRADYFQHTPTYWRQHYLIGLLLAELKTAMEQGEVESKQKVVGIIQRLLASHSTSITKAEDRGKLSLLYLPLLSVMLESMTILNTITEEREVTTDPTLAAIASSSVLQAMGSVPYKKDQGGIGGIGAESTRQLLVSFLWLAKHLPVVCKTNFCIALEHEQLVVLLDTLELCLETFEYQSNRSTKKAPGKVSNMVNSARLQHLQEAILSGQAAKDMLQRKSEGVESSRFRWKKEQTKARKIKEDGPKIDPEIINSMDANLAAEVTFVVLDWLDVLVHALKNMKQEREVLVKVVRVVLGSLSRNHSVQVFEPLLAFQRYLLLKFQSVLLEDEPDLCSELCSKLLRLCGSNMTEIRTQASASLYQLLFQGFESAKNFTRIKVLLTMALSRLVSSNDVCNEENLRSSLKTILSYAESTKTPPAPYFCEQVRELVLNLHMILRDTMKMKGCQEDPEMAMDMMYRIARHYQNSPDLRLTWLQDMANRHVKLNRHAEAALCMVHASALVAEYLRMRTDESYLPIGCVSFLPISSNVIEESLISDEVVSMVDSIVSDKNFSEMGVVNLLENAAASFMQAHMYEMVSAVYKIVVPILEAKREWKKLTACHAKMSDAFAKIQTASKRVLGSYFRVGFYGKLFDDLDGEEFVYKEPSITMLPEISGRLHDFYTARFSPTPVEIIKDSNLVDPTKLHPEKAYIQISFVEPYFEDWEKPSRVTFFQQNHDLKRFVFTTPFTTAGKAHGEISTQYKRKTILTVASSFPYIKTRVVVESREEIVLNPVEVAVEDIQKRTLEIQAAYQMDPPDAKFLQMVLQGCIGTTVNQGPLEVARVFLGDFDASQILKDPLRYRDLNKLRLCFKQMADSVKIALHKNSKLITPEQHQYQREMEKNFKETVIGLMPLLEKSRKSSSPSIGTIDTTRPSSALLRSSTRSRSGKLTQSLYAV